jgi:hypothetical protein
MTQLPDFKTPKERDEYFLANAEFYTVIQRLSPYSIDRHECKDYDEAVKVACDLVCVTGRPYMIYSVIGPYDSFIKSVTPERHETKPSNISSSA